MQCDQVGRFFKVLGNKFAHKITPKSLVVTFGAISKRIIVCKNCFFYYLGNFWKHSFKLKHLVTLFLCFKSLSLLYVYLQIYKDIKLRQSRRRQSMNQQVTNAGWAGALV